MCASDILPGPAATTTSEPASNINSNSTPPSPVRLVAFLTYNIAPSIMMANIDAEIRVKIPTINNIPGIISANAIGICISGGNPNCPVRNPPNPGFSFPEPCTMKIIPIADLMPHFVMSFNFVL